MAMRTSGGIRYATAEEFAEGGWTCPQRWAELIAVDHGTTLERLAEEWPPLARTMRDGHVSRSHLLEALGY